MLKSKEFFRKRIKDLLVKWDWSQQDLAKRTGIPQSQLNRYLVGKHSPNLDKIDQIAQAFDLSAQDLVNPDKEPDSQPSRITPEDALKILESAIKELKELQAQLKNKKMDPNE